MDHLQHSCLLVFSRVLQWQLPQVPADWLSERQEDCVLQQTILEAKTALLTALHPRLVLLTGFLTLFPEPLACPHQGRTHHFSPALLPASLPRVACNRVL